MHPRADSAILGQMASKRGNRWSRNAKVKRLAQVPLFDACSKTDLARIAALADELDVPAGRVLMRQGEFGHECFVILDGEARVSFRGRRATKVGPAPASARWHCSNRAASVRRP